MKNKPLWGLKWSFTRYFVSSIGKDKFMHRLILVLAFLLSVFFGQSQEYYHGKYHVTRKINVGDGLSQSYAYKILQDSSGLVWVTTQVGVNKIAGEDIIVYNRNPDPEKTLPHSWVYNMELSEDNKIWITSLSGGVFEFDPRLETFKAYTQNDTTQSLSSNIVHALRIDWVGRKWAATTRGVDIIDDQRIITIAEYTDQAISSVTTRDVAFDHSRHWVFVGSNGQGLFIWDDDQQEVRHFSVESGHLPSDRIYHLLLEGTTLWISTVSGLVKLDILDESYQWYQANGTDTGLVHSKVHLTYRDNEDVLWIGTAGGVSLLKNGKVFHHLLHDPNDPRSISHNYTFTFMEDPSGNMWIGNRDGISIIAIGKPPIEQFHTLEFPDLDLDQVWGLAEVSDNELLIGTRYDGLQVFNLDHSSYAPLPVQGPDDTREDTYIQFIFREDESTFWLAEYGSNLYQYDLASKRLKLVNDVFPGFNGYTDIIIPDQVGGLLLGTVNAGLLQVKDQQVKQWKTEETSTSMSTVASLAIDPQGNYWAGGRFNLYHLDRENLELKKTLNPVEELNYPFNVQFNFLDLVMSPDGFLWCATDFGLIKVNPTTYEMELFDEGEGLEGNVLYALLHDGDRTLWVSTTTGLISFDTDSEILMNHYDSGKGLIIPEFNSRSRYQGKKHMYFGGVDGFVRFDPKAVQKSTFQPQVIFTGASINFEPIDTLVDIAYRSQVVLDYDHNMLSFEFASDEYQSPEHVNYRYHIRGFNDQWVALGNETQISFSGLAPQEYKLRLNCTNRDGVWSDKITEMTILINPPWWLTIWAKLGGVLLVSFLFYAVYRVRTSYIRKENEKLDHEVRRRTQELSEQNATIIEQSRKLRDLDQIKTRFFTNISHELRTPLTLVLSPLNGMINETGLDLKTREQLRVSQQNGHRLLKMINELLDFSKLESGQLTLQVSSVELTSLVRKCIDLFKSASWDKQMGFELINDLDDDIVYADYDKLEKVVTNLLGNAVKFSEPKSKIRLHLREDEGHLMVDIKDQGPGIPRHELEKIFDRYYQAKNNEKAGSGIGLSLAHELMELHKGSLTCESTPGEGSTFTIVLQKGKDHFPQKLFLDRSVKLKRRNQLSSYESVDGVILLVEDNADMRNYIKSVLSDFEVIEAMNGKEALALYDENDVDLIITDYMMPEMDGMEMVTILKKYQADIPVIFLTARTAAEDKISALKIGVEDYMIKPFNEQELIARVNNLLANKKSRTTVELPEESSDDGQMNAFESYVLENIDRTEFSVKDMAENFAMSTRTLQRTLKAELGMSPNEYIREMKLSQARKLLEHKQHKTVSEVAYACGFDNLSYFSKKFKDRFGVSPSEFE